MENEQIYRKLLIIEQYLTEIFDANFEKKQCPVCGEKIRLYVPYVNQAQKDPLCCPACWALPRIRLLALYLEASRSPPFFQKDVPAPFRMLHFGPEVGFLKKFQHRQEIEYVPADMNPWEDTIRKEDIQQMSFEDNYFDALICSHVLEHVEDDRKAIDEMFRVLKPGGIAYIMIPKTNNQNTWKTPALDKTIEESFPLSDEQRTLLYGQADHKRLYADDFIERLERFSVEVITPESFLDKQQIETHKLGHRSAGEIYVCTKPANGVEQG